MHAVVEFYVGSTYGNGYMLLRHRHHWLSATGQRAIDAGRLQHSAQLRSARLRRLRLRLSG